MKYIKMLGLLAVAAAALMAFAGTASATLTDGTTGAVLTSLHAEDEGTHVVLTGGSTTITCTFSTVGGSITTQHENHVSGPLSTLEFAGCNHTVTVAKNGTLTTTDKGKNEADVSSSGAEVTVLAHVPFFGTVHCTYVTSNTPIGTLTGSGHKENATTTATFHINAQIPKDPETSPSGQLCSTTSTWEGNYVVTNPDHLVID